MKIPNIAAAMDIREAGEYIKDNVSMRTVVELYGYHPASGYINCPFHAGDRTASLKIYEKKGGVRVGYPPARAAASSSAGGSSRTGWYCFGCHAGGSALDFVMLHDYCDYATAVRTLDQALSLRLLIPKPLGSFSKATSCQRLSRLLDDAEAVLLEAVEVEKSLLRSEYDLTWKAWRAVDLIPGRDRTAADWTSWQNLREQLDYLDYKMAKLNDCSEEVRAWRRQCRRPGGTKTPAANS